MEVALSVRILQRYRTYAQELSKCVSHQEDLRRINNEIEILIDIEESKETINFYIEEEEPID